ncbi:putative HAD superfamily protein [Cytobacillus eiseniae]|uniref:Nucleotidase n=1 Tax=Cytobacillus eiseniae TaxID=762947 RepID=A0ABS4RFG4_9BACI|nr:hypothetical protein [Cytobacillus eiseniae]MBP2241642.1 putative HAD superfamily protein [Cytobacillus eiseniae]
MKKRFGIDIDGTITCPASILPYINKDFNVNITLNDVTKYDLTCAVNISEDVFADWFVNNEPLIYAESPLAAGAREILKKWELKHELFFISARGPHLLEITKEWFLEKTLHFDHIDLLGTHNKIQAAKKYQVDLFFEDKHDNAVMIHEECNIPVLLFDTPYNQEPIPNGVIRVNNWLEANAWVENWLK